MRKQRCASLGTIPPGLGHSCPDTAPEKPGGTVGLRLAGSGRATTGFHWGLRRRSWQFQVNGSKVQKRWSLWWNCHSYYSLPATEHIKCFSWEEIDLACRKNWVLRQQQQVGVTVLVRRKNCCAKTEIAWAILTEFTFDLLISSSRLPSTEAWLDRAPSLYARSIMAGLFYYIYLCYVCYVMYR